MAPCPAHVSVTIEPAAPPPGSRAAVHVPVCDGDAHECVDLSGRCLVVRRASIRGMR